MTLLKLANELDEFQEVTAPRELSLLEERYLEKNNPTFSNKAVGVTTAALSAPLGIAAYVEGNNSHFNEVGREAINGSNPRAFAKKNIKAAHLKGLRQAAGWGGATALATGATMLATKRGLQKEHDAEKNLLLGMSQDESHDFIDRTNGLAPRNDTLIIL